MKTSETNHYCPWHGCTLKGSCLHGNSWYCSWHDYCLDDPKKNNHSGFIDWVDARLKRLDPHGEHDLSDDCHQKDAHQRKYLDDQGRVSYVPIERMCPYCYESKKVLRIFTWENVSSF